MRRLITSRRDPGFDMGQVKADARLLLASESLKNEIKDRHVERNQLRRELQKVVLDLDALKQRSEALPAQAPASEAKDETELFVEPEAADDNNQGIRLPEFPARFHDQLAILPKSVARHALTLIGRIVSGEPSAFRGMKRLSTNREILPPAGGGH